MGRKRLHLMGLLVMALVAGMVFALFHEEIHERYFLSEEEKLRREAAAFFACKPEKPLSKEELFARAMQNYWRREIGFLWEMDQMLYEEYIPHEKTDFTDNLCGLVRDKRGNPVRITRDTCYPWKITEYSSREKLCARIQEVPDLLKAKEVHWHVERDSRTGFMRKWREDGLNTYDDIVRDILYGQVVHPETELPYSPEDLNDGRASFAVMHNAGPWIAWYEPDCCRLVMYNEFPEYKKRKNDPLGISPYLRHLPPGTRIEDVIFLQVKYCFIDSPWPRDRWEGVFDLSRGKIDEFAWAEQGISTNYFIISPCGTLLPAGH